VLLKNHPLQSYNTFRINAKAKHFLPIYEEKQLIDFLLKKDFDKEQLFVLGGGSNVLFKYDFEGCILKNEMRGIRIVDEDKDGYLVQAAGGEDWHLFVQYCVANNLAGIENLSLIPGTVGASPVQNIGAYGVELDQVFHSLETVHLASAKKMVFSKADCQFSYRNSIFKNTYKGQFFITSVTFRLTKNPNYKLDYGAIKQELDKLDEPLSLRLVSDVICKIRQSKLPDPRTLGNCGSFFKNPIIEKSKYEKLKEDYQAIPSYPASAGMVKIPAAWLIQQCDWKGYKKGDSGVYKNHALVLVNYGTASGKNIYDLSSEIMESVHNRFGIQLEREVQVQ